MIFNVEYQIRASSLRRQHFAHLAKTFHEELQLLRDVDTRWSSTMLMIERALHLEPVCIFIYTLYSCLTSPQVIEAFLKSPEFEDLKKYMLSDADWQALVTTREILLVC